MKSHTNAYNIITSSNFAAKHLQESDDLFPIQLVSDPSMFADHLQWPCYDNDTQ